MLFAYRGLILVVRAVGIMTFDRITLKNKLEAKCTRIDIKELIFDLGLNTDDFPVNVSLTEQIRKLIEFMDRRELLDAFVEQLYITCPHVFED